MTYADVHLVKVNIIFVFRFSFFAFLLFVFRFSIIGVLQVLTVKYLSTRESVCERVSELERECFTSIKQLMQ